MLLAYAPPQMSEAWLLLDPASLLLTGILLGDQPAMDDSGVLKLSQFGPWRQFEAASYPAEIALVTVLSNGEVVRERPVQTYAVSAAPKQAREWFGIDNAPPVPAPELPGGQLTLPFRLHDDDITLDASGPGGRPLVLKLDTGANIGLLRRDVALALGCTPAGAQPVSGHGATGDLQLARAQGIRLGNIELPAYTAGVMSGGDIPQPGEAWL